MKAQTAGLIVSYKDNKVKTKSWTKACLSCKKIDAYAKPTKHCEIATDVWFVMSPLARRHSNMNNRKDAPFDKWCAWNFE